MCWIRVEGGASENPFLDPLLDEHYWWGSITWAPRADLKSTSHSASLSLRQNALVSLLDEHDRVGSTWPNYWTCQRDISPRTQMRDLVQRMPVVTHAHKSLTGLQRNQRVQQNIHFYVWSSNLVSFTKSKPNLKQIDSLSTRKRILAPCWTARFLSIRIWGTSKRDHHWKQRGNWNWSVYSL